MKIFHRFNLVIIFVIVAVVLAYSIYSISAKKRELTREMTDQATYYSRTIAMGINSTSFLGGRDLLVDYMDRAVPESKGWIKYAIVTNLDNYAWIHTIKDFEYGTLDDATSRNALKNIDGTNSYAQTYYSDYLKEKILDVASVINVNLQDRGILRFGFSFENVNRKINSAVFESVIICIFSIAVGIILSTFLSKHVTNPISKIVETSKAVAAGNINLPISTKSNITEIKELEKSIEEMKRDLKYIYLGGVFSDFHHAIKSDLGLISANMQYIRNNAGLPERQEDVRKKAEQITERVDYIASEINKYREYKKPKDVKKTSTDINELLNELCAPIPEKIVRKTEYHPQIPKISADPDHLKKALGNIIGNAIDAMPDGGTLKITTGSREQEVEINISDTGVGIALEDLPKIFQPNFTTKKKRGGEGIGLAIAKIIIEDVHDGKIEVQSRPGAGTTFNITLPY